MAIEKLEIEITSNSGKTASAVNRLVTSLDKLKAATNGDLGLGKVSRQIKEITQNIPVLASLSTVAREVTKTLERLGTDATREAVRNIQQAASNMDNLNNNANKAVSRIELLPSTLARMAKENISAPLENAATATKELSGSISSAVGNSENLQAELGTLDKINPDISPIGTNKWNEFIAMLATTPNYFTAIKSAASGVFGTLKATAKTIGIIAKGAGKAAVGIGKAATNAMRLALGFGKANKQAGFFGTTIGRALKSIILYRALRKLLTNLSQGFREGTQNIARFSSAANAAMSSIITDTLYLKNALGAMAAPAVEALVPLFRILTDAIVGATNAVGMFIAALTGKGFFVKATRSAQDYIDAIDGAGKALKALKSVATSIDELNVLEDTSGGGGGAGAIDVSDMFETVEIPSTIADFAKALKDAFLNQDFDWFHELGEKVGKGLTDALSSIPWDFIQEWSTATVAMFAHFLNGAVEGADWSVVGYTVGQAINTVFGVINTWYTTFDFSAFGEAVAEGINHALYTTDFELIGATIANKLNATIRFLAGVVENLDWMEVGYAIGDALTAIIDNLDAATLVSGLNAFAIGIVDAIATFIGTVDWSDVGYKMADMLNGIKWNNIITGAFSTAADIVNAIVDVIVRFASTFDLSEIGRAIANGINEFFTKFDAAEFASGLSTLAINLLNTLVDIVGKVDWKQIGNTIKDFILNIDWSGLIEGLATLAASVVGGAFDVIKGIVGDKLAGLGAIITGIIIGFFAGGPHGAAVGAMMSGVVAIADLYFSALKLTTSDALNDLKAAVDDTFDLSGRWVDATDIMGMSAEELAFAIKDTGFLMQEMSDIFGTGLDVDPLFDQIDLLKEALKMHEIKLEVVRFSSAVSDSTKNMLTPLLNNADEARRALLSMFAEAQNGYPSLTYVTQESTLTIAGYIKDMADSSINDLRRMQDAALDSLAFVFGEESVDFERRLREATRFYEDRLAQIDRDGRTLADTVRENMLVVTDVEQRGIAERIAANEDGAVALLAVYDQETQDKIQALADALAAEQNYLDTVKDERQVLTNAIETETQRLIDLHKDSLDPMYLEQRDLVVSTYAEQEEAVKASTAAMLNIMSENMQEGKEFTLQNFEAMTNGMESFLDTQVELLVSDASEKTSIAQTRNDDLYRIDRAHLNAIQEGRDRAYRDEQAALEKRHADEKAETDRHWQSMGQLYSEGHQEAIRLQEVSQNAEMQLLDRRYSAQQNSLESHFEKNYDLTEHYGVITGVALVEGTANAINAGTQEMVSAWSDGLQEMLARGDETIGRRSPAQATYDQAEDLVLGMELGITENAPIAVTAMQYLMNDLVDVVKEIGGELKIAFTEAFEEGVNLDSATTSAIKQVDGLMKDVVGTIKKAEGDVKGAFSNLFSKGIISETDKFSTSFSQKITQSMTQVTNTIRNTSTPIVNLFKTMYTNITNETQRANTTMTNQTNTMLNTMQSSVRNFITPFENLFKTMYTNITNEATRASTTMTSTTTSMMSAIQSTVSDATTPIINLFASMYTTIGTSATTAATNMKTATTTLMTNITSAVTDNALKFENAFKNMYNNILGHTQTFGNNLIKGINDAVEQAAKALNSLPDTKITIVKGANITVPKLNIGHPFIPYDNYPAILHRGERVLTAQENRDYGREDDQSTIDRIAEVILRLAERPIDVRSELRVDGRVLATAVERGQAEKGESIFDNGYAFGLGV